MTRFCTFALLSLITFTGASSAAPDQARLKTCRDGVGTQAVKSCMTGSRGKKTVPQCQAEARPIIMACMNGK